MAKRKDLTGEKFGRLTVIGVGAGKKAKAWLCKCDCGEDIVVITSKLNTGHTRSCGCLKSEAWLMCVNKINITHGKHGTPEYNAWKNMKKRCLNPSHKSYPNYGGRGIKVCNRWLEFKNFYKDMGERTSSIHSLDRINNDGDYEPLNCRWGTRQEQNNNKRTTRFYNFYGTNKTLAEWSRIVGISHAALFDRLKRGWTLHQTLTTPLL
jgi:hypothetical protein